MTREKSRSVDEKTCDGHEETRGRRREGEEIDYRTDRSLEDAVRSHYERFPYPPREHGRHRFGIKALKDCLPSMINDVVYGGSKTFSRSSATPFRVLVAGGGTGDPTLSCAHAFAASGFAAEIVHLDLSASSNEIAAKRFDRFQDNWFQGDDARRVRVIFVRGSILDIPMWIRRDDDRKVVSDSWPSSRIVDTSLNVVDTSANEQNAKDLARLFSPGFDYIHW